MVLCVRPAVYARCTYICFWLLLIPSSKLGARKPIYCHLHSSQQTTEFLHSNNVISLPTFIIAECVLIYLDPDSSSAVVGWASKAFSTAVFFLYEQVRCLSDVQTLDQYFVVSLSQCFEIKWLKLRIIFRLRLMPTDSSIRCFWAAND